MPHPENILTPIVLIAPHRSGTSLVANAFDRHPCCSYAGETANLIFQAWDAVALAANNIPPLQEAGQWVADDERAARVVRRTMLTAVPNDRSEWFQKPLGIPRALSARFGNDAWDAAGTYYWRVLRQSFPQARYFTVLRPPCDVVLSISELWGFDQGAAWWAVGFMAALLLHPDSPVTHAVVFEELIADPATTLRRLCDHVRLPFDEAMLGAFTTIHAPSDTRSYRAGADPSRREQWPTLDPRLAAPAFVRPIQRLYERFQVPWELPPALAARLAESAGAEPAAQTAADPEAMVIKLNQKIEALHLEYAEKLREQERAAHKVYTEQAVWIEELRAGETWLTQQGEQQRAVAEERQRIIYDQQAWIAKLTEAKSWLEQQRDYWQQTAASRPPALLPDTPPSAGDTACQG